MYEVNVEKISEFSEVLGAAEQYDFQKARELSKKSAQIILHVGPAQFEKMAENHSLYA